MIIFILTIIFSVMIKYEKLNIYYLNFLRIFYPVLFTYLNLINSDLYFNAVLCFMSYYYNIAPGKTGNGRPDPHSPSVCCAPNMIIIIL